MTLAELSLYLEGYRNQQEELMRITAMGAWLNAKLQRAKKIMSFERLWKSPEQQEARPLPPDEAEQEKSRHLDLISRLAPELSDNPIPGK